MTHSRRPKSGNIRFRHTGETTVYERKETSMKFKLFPRNLFAAAFAALFLTLAGCGTAAPLSPDGDAASSEADSSVFPSVSSAEPLTDGTDASAAPTTAPAETGETESAQPTEAPQKEKKENTAGKDEDTKSTRNEPSASVVPKTTARRTTTAAASTASTTARRTTAATTIRATTARPTTASTTAGTTKRTTTPTTRTTAASSDAGFQAAFENEVVRLVNEERAKQGLSALSVSTELRDTARLRSQEIVRSFSHTRPDGSSCFTAFPDWNGTKAENIAAGYATPAKVMEGWMNSEGHRKNILTPGLRYIGVGCYESGGRYYWAQAFFG